MDVEGIMRIYNELQTAVIDLQRELESIPEKSDEWNIIHSIIDAIKDTSKTFMDLDESATDRHKQTQEQYSVSSRSVFFWNNLKLRTDLYQAENELFIEALMSGVTLALRMKKKMKQRNLIKQIGCERDWRR